MLILILVKIQYLQNVVFSFEKGSDGQSHYLQETLCFFLRILSRNFEKVLRRSKGSVVYKTIIYYKIHQVVFGRVAQWDG